MGKYNEGICAVFALKPAKWPEIYKFPHMDICLYIHQKLLHSLFATNIYAPPGKCYNGRGKGERPCADAISWSATLGRGASAHTGRSRRAERTSICGDVFPTDSAPALADGRILSMRWGFRAPAAGGHQRPQRDGAGKAMFRGAGRCLLPASGYYEWGGEQKRRYAFAGRAAQSIWPASGGGRRTGESALSSSPAKRRRRRRACTRACPCCSTGSCAAPGWTRAIPCRNSCARLWTTFHLEAEP